MKVIAGNCVLEDKETTLETATFLGRMSKLYGFELIYKSSWHKDNRSAADSYVGPDVPESYEIFKALKEKRFIVLTDVHETGALAQNYFGPFVDIYQLPAYLCMQTSLVSMLAMMGKPINIKKGQFLAPEDIGSIINKFRYFKKDIPLMLTDRGTCFGYHDLVFDTRSIYHMKQFEYPVFADIGHMVRKYGIPSKLASGGSKQYVSTYGRVAVAAGADGLFVEVHPNPPEALCDAATQLSFDEFEKLIFEVMPIWKSIHS